MMPLKSAMVGLFVSVLALALGAACVSTELETPVNHPANPEASVLPLSSTRVLDKGFEASSSDTSSPKGKPESEPEPKQHEHGGAH